VDGNIGEKRTNIGQQKVNKVGTSGEEREREREKQRENEKDRHNGGETRTLRPTQVSSAYLGPTATNANVRATFQPKTRFRVE